MDLDKSSSGEIFLDAPEADLAALATPAARGPESSDEIVEIDWSEIDGATSESSSVVDLSKDAYVELESPSSDSAPRPRAKADHPSSAEIALPPEQRAPGTPSVPLAVPVQPPLAAKAEAAEAPSSFTMPKPVAPGQAPAQPAAPAAGGWDENELIDIEHLTAGDESSVVDLGSGPRRRKDRRTDPAHQAPDSSSGNLIEISREEALLPEDAESSAVDLSSTPEVDLPASQSAAVDLPTEMRSEGAAAYRDEEPSHFHEPDLEALREPDLIEVEEEPVAVAPAKKPGRAVAGLVGGVVGAALATAACGAIWFSGLLPESKRGNPPNPAPAPAPAQAQMNPQEGAPAVAPREDARTLLDRGDYARILESVPDKEGQESNQADLLALRGEAQWRSYLLQQRQQGQPLKAGDKPVEDAKASLAKSKTPEGTLWLGQIQEGLGDLAGARKIYEDGLKQYQDKPALARMFQTALRRVEALEDVPEQDAVDGKQPEVKGLKQGALSRPGLMLVALLGEPPAGANAATPADELEAGDYFWEALQLARQNKYAEAIHTLDRAATVHKQRRFLRQNKSQNPKSDPAEQIFLKCCHELEAYWKLRLRLAEGGYLDVAKQRSALKAVDNLIKEAKAPKSDPAVQVAIDKLKKDKDATAQDPEVKDLGKGLDAVLAAKNKAEEQLAAVKSTLAEAKAVSDKQPDPVKGIEQLLQDKKQAADALKQAMASLAALKTGNNEALTATLKLLQAEKYITADQPSIPKGVERLVADKKAADAKLEDATAKTKAAEAAVKATEDRAKALDTQVKAEMDRNKALLTQLTAAQAKTKDLDVKVQTAEAKLKDLPRTVKAAEDKARNDVRVQLEPKLEEAYARLKAADDTLRAVAVKLAAARVVSPDARGTDLVRGAEQVVRLAMQQPRTVTNPAVIRPQDTGSVPPAVPVEYRNDPILAEQYYNRGLSFYWSRRYGAAEGDFEEAIRTAGQAAEDARFFYFLGLSQLGLGKTADAQVAFQQAGNLERNHRPSSAAVNASLERVQGPVRRYVDAFRR